VKGAANPRFFRGFFYGQTLAALPPSDPPRSLPARRRHAQNRHTLSLGLRHGVPSIHGGSKPTAPIFQSPHRNSITAGTGYPTVLWRESPARLTTTQSQSVMGSRWRPAVIAGEVDSATYEFSGGDTLDPQPTRSVTPSRQVREVQTVWAYVYCGACWLAGMVLTRILITHFWSSELDAGAAKGLSRWIVFGFPIALRRCGCLSPLPGCSTASGAVSWAHCDCESWPSNTASRYLHRSLLRTTSGLTRYSPN